MRMDIGEGEALLNPRSFKVHGKMCTELAKLVDRISRIVPDIEAARPGFSSGIESLCLLNNTIEKAKVLVQHCSECSKLYLVMTGDTVLSRCLKTTRLLEKSLIQIQNMVPVMLAVKISRIIHDLECTRFVLDPDEEEAGRVVKELLTSTSDSVDDSEVKALQSVASRLKITSARAIVTEQRSIRKLLDKLGPNEVTKKRILKYLLLLLKKHAKLLVEEHEERVYSSEEHVATENSYDDSLRSHHVESDQSLNYDQYITHTSELGGVDLPEQYKCPISSRLMYDPVIIESGVTYERMWIKKWFDKGNDICPKTGKKLIHTALTPNVAMKDLISKWCRKNGVSIPDPSRQAEDISSWEASSTSINSIGSYFNDFNPPVDLSNMSIGSLDASFSSDASHGRTTRGSMLIRSSDNSGRHQVHTEIHDTDLMLLPQLGDLQWDSQCKVIQDLKDHLKSNSQAFVSVSADNLLEPLLRFLNSAYDLRDVQALRAGTQLLLEFVNNCRNGNTNWNEETFIMLASFLDSEATEEILAILEELSGRWYNAPKIAASSALNSILSILDFEKKGFQQQAIRIMYNLSFIGEVCPRMLSLKCIPKLLPFFEDRNLLRYCIRILKNLCDTEEGRNSVAETKGCISSVTEILNTGNNEEQEHALAVLVSLCSHVDYLKLVMSEHDNIIPSLFLISQNGNDKGKKSALELIHLLDDVNIGDNKDCPEPNTSNSCRDSNTHPPEENRPLKKSTFLKKLSPFSKSSSHGSKSKR
ncbi:U-box domain-containing protein 5 isoform X1 [Vigna radiata var. radiata]|uniref:RING-type E3 ubiquitin transferase n=2 Tax=Vigna radiata var. radiata TaxID=3916 RepID=A0A1S3VSF4_VIGRR|nr:U-box domain-containing protein 5 isoform X1 [Vigna radiata var. radiata]